MVEVYEAGVETSKFQVHSTRVAATSKAAISGLAVRAADWSSNSVFQKFYYKSEFVLSLDQ